MAISGAATSGTLGSFGGGNGAPSALAGLAQAAEAPAPSLASRCGCLAGNGMTQILEQLFTWLGFETGTYMQNLKVP